MNHKHKRTLASLFAVPPPHSMTWDALQALLVALGASMNEGEGSRVKFDLNGVTVAFHRPHNPKILSVYQVKTAKEFLERMGVRP